MNNRIRFLIPIVLALLLAGGPNAFAAPVSAVSISVPHRSAPQFEISALKITMQLTSDDPVTLQVAGPHGTKVITIDPKLASGTACGPAGCFVDFDPAPAPATSTDALVVITPEQAGFDPSNTEHRKLVMLLQLLSNSNEAVPLCTSTMQPGNETWTFTVTSPPAQRIDGIAVQSLDRKAAGACPSTQFRAIPSSDGPVATITQPAPVLETGRQPLDAVLVLDRSGSMSSTDLTASSRLDKLKTATTQFLTMWKDLRKSEADLQIQAPQDHVGIVFFDHATQWTTGTATNRMVDFNDAALPGLVSGVTAVPLGGSTSIGNGLIAATDASGLPAAGSGRRIVLLMTDGAQNTSKFAFASGGQVKTSDDQGNAAGIATLPKQPFQLYTVTVGNAFGPDAPINQALAAATKGYTLNTTKPAADLQVFFLQTLQNALKFSTLETMRIVQDTTRSSAPFQMQFPVTSTTTRLALNLSSDSRRNNLRATLTPPGGGTPIQIVAAPGNAGFLSDSFRLPLPGGVNTTGSWTLRVTANNDSDVPVPFVLMLMGDDSTLSSSVGVVGAEHAVGGKVKLTAQVNDFDRTLKGLDLQAGATIKAFVVTPGNNVGDVLSASAAQPAPPPPGDLATPAQGKLDAILAQDPAALTRVSGEVLLRDDGSAASGDDQAGDGIYSALVPADTEGHYNFVFVIEGVSRSGGQFVRQQVRTAHVRSLPAASNTSVVANVVGNTVVTTIRPRNVRNGHVGPGWANYFWFQPASGAPVKPVDNLDGTYTATVPFSGQTPPVVSVHFLPEPVVRPSGFVPEPGQLTAGNELIADVTKAQAAPGRWAVWVAGGVAIPHGGFHNGYGRDIATGLGIEYTLTPTTSLEGTVGLHRFKGKNLNPDVDVMHYGVNGKLYIPMQPWRPFLTAGLGAYDFDPGSTHFGANLGAGAQYEINSRLALEGRYAHHWVAGNAPNSRYSTLLIGLRYAF